MTDSQKPSIPSSGLRTNMVDLGDTGQILHVTAGNNVWEASVAEIAEYQALFDVAIKSLGLSNTVVVATRSGVNLNTVTV